MGLTLPYAILRVFFHPSNPSRMSTVCILYLCKWLGKPYKPHHFTSSINAIKLVLGIATLLCHSPIPSTLAFSFTSVVLCVARTLSNLVAFVYAPRFLRGDRSPVAALCWWPFSVFLCFFTLFLQLAFNSLVPPAQALPLLSFVLYSFPLCCLQLS